MGSQVSKNNDTIALGGEGPLSADWLWQLIEVLRDMTQEVGKVILEYKKDIWNEKELFESVKEYFDSSANAMDFYNALLECLQRARDSQSRVLEALQQLDKETEKVGHSRDARKLQALKNLKAAGDPFTEAFFQKYQSVYAQQKRMLAKLESRKMELDKKLKRKRTLRRVWGVICVVTAATVIISSFVVGAVGSPDVARAFSIATAIPVGLMGKGFALWKNYENALERQKKVTDSALCGTFDAKNNLDNIRFSIAGLKREIESLMKDVDSAIEQEAVNVEIEKIKEKLVALIKNFKDLQDIADKYSRDVEKARKDVQQKINSAFYGKN